MIELARLRRDLEELAEIGRLPGGGLYRPAFSAADRQAREWLVARLANEGFEVRIDAAGNISALLPGTSPPVVCGSHIDTVEGGGFLDGALGVLAGLECLRCLRDENNAHAAAVELIAFSDEEERFLGFLGSFAFTGRLSAVDLGACKDRRGVLLGEAMARCGLDLKRIEEAKRNQRDIRAFVELHVEQGPLLEEAGVPVGIVDTIKGNYRYQARLAGRRDHAGIPMRGRKDPLLAAAGLIVAQQEIASRRKNGETLLTVGSFSADPGISNIIPASVSFTIDFRNSKRRQLEALEKQLRRRLDAVCRRAGLDGELLPLCKINPVTMSAGLRKIIAETADELHLPWRAISSGAGHDAQVLGISVPTGLIFVPSRGGRSHCPQEVTDWKDIEAGANVLLGTLRRLAGQEYALRL
jgi:N-carbamoyl-L-amino-acid hydrolase